MEELQRLQHPAHMPPSPEQEEQHAAEVQHLQQQVQRLQEESASYRYTALNEKMRLLGIHPVQKHCLRPF